MQHSSLVFLVGVLFWSTWRMVPSILKGRQPWYFPLWWDFCYVVWFRVIFCSSEVFFFFLFSFISAWNFHTRVSCWCSFWSVSDSEFSQISRTFQSILASLKNTLVCMVSIWSPVLPSLFFKPFGIYPKCTSYSSYYRHLLQDQSICLSHPFFEIFARNSKKLKRTRTLFLLIITRTDLLAEIKWTVCIPKIKGIFSSHFLGWILVCVYTIW